MYWQNDKQRDSTVSLNTLISNVGKMDLHVFIIKYLSISGTLVEQGAMSALDGVNRLLDGLTESLRD
jgi:hypothetical protein